MNRRTFFGRLAAAAVGGALAAGGLALPRPRDEEPDLLVKGFGGPAYLCSDGTWQKFVRREDGTWDRIAFDPYTWDEDRRTYMPYRTMLAREVAPRLPAGHA